MMRTLCLSTLRSAGGDRPDEPAGSKPPAGRARSASHAPAGRARSVAGRAPSSECSLQMSLCAHWLGRHAAL